MVHTCRMLRTVTGSLFCGYMTVLPSSLRSRRLPPLTIEDRASGLMGFELRVRVNTIDSVVFRAVVSYVSNFVT